MFDLVVKDDLSKEDIKVDQGDFRRCAVGIEKRIKSVQGLFAKEATRDA